MLWKRKLVDNEKEMEHFRIILNEVKSSKDEIYQIIKNEFEFDGELYNSL